MSISLGVLRKKGTMASTSSGAMQPGVVETPRTPSSSRRKRFRSLSPNSRELANLVTIEREERDDELIRAQMGQETDEAPSTDLPQRIVAQRAQLILSGYRNVSDFSFKPLQPASLPIRIAARVLRRHQMTLPAAFKTFLPMSIHQLFFTDCNKHLAARSAERKSKKPCGTNLPSYYRPLQWREYWLFWVTHLLGCVLSHSSVDNLYLACPEEFRGQLLPQERYRKVKAMMYVEDLQALSQLSSSIWCKEITMPEVVCVDESLWKFLASFLGTNANMVVQIPRKPANRGVLSYEASCICPDSGLAYVMSISPRLTVSLSPNDALVDCLFLIKEKSPSGRLPIVVADSAFSSSQTLEWMHQNGFPFVVSGNSGWHAVEHQVCSHDLDVFTFRSILSPGEFIFTAYKTEYLQTGSSTKKTVVQDVFCITNCFSAIPPPSSSSPDVAATSSSDHQAEPPVGSSAAEDQLLSAQMSMARSLLTQPKAMLLSWASKESAIMVDPDSTPWQLACIIARLPAGSLEESAAQQAGTSAPSSSRKKGPPPPNVTLFVQNTSHDTIRVGADVISRDQILQMNIKDLRSYMKMAQPHSSLQGKKRGDLILSLWDIKRVENQGVLAQQMVPFAKLQKSTTEKHTLEASLPFIYLYRKHFASVDRLDQFLSYLDSSVKTLSAKVRLSERIFMCGVSNAHTWFCEEKIRKKWTDGGSELRSAKNWGLAVIRHLISLANSSTKQ